MSDECEITTCTLEGREVVIYGHHFVLCESHFKETMDELEKEKEQ